NYYIVRTCLPLRSRLSCSVAARCCQCLRFHARGSGNAKAVVTTRTGRSCRWIAEVSKHERAPALPGVSVPLHCLQLGQLRGTAPIEHAPVDTELREGCGSLSQIKATT